MPMGLSRNEMGQDRAVKSQRTSIWSMLFGSPDKQSQSARERRDAPRRELTVLCTTSFRLNDEEKRAILLDVSSGGARFGTAAATGTLTLSRDQVLDFDLVTPFGITTCKGRVVWADSDDVLYTWGVEFVGDTRIDADPIRVLLG
ncbi:MAG: hypothetical protein GF331_17840 [Chitinivibrionales bacterium]|nr:hypothetical protein [Chitinivibrionales bacterium]